MPSRGHVEAIMRRERERFARGPMTKAEEAEFESSKAKEMATAERRRSPQPQLELPETIHA